MEKIDACRLIIKDDFNNVLVLKKKAKRGQIENWSLLNQKIRGKESEEKCVNRAIKDALKAIIFDLEAFGQYDLNEENEESEEVIKVYIGDLKERFVLDKKYDEAKWINKNDLDNYQFEEIDKKILEDYYN